MNRNRVCDLERENLKLQEDNRVLRGQVSGDPHFRIAVRLGLSRKPARLLSILLSSDLPMTVRDLSYRLYGASFVGAKDRAIEANMTIVRRALKSRMLTIRNKRGMGWWITKEDRRALLVKLGRGDNDAEQDNPSAHDAGGLDRRRVRALAPSRG